MSFAAARIRLLLRITLTALVVVALLAPTASAASGGQAPDQQAALADRLGGELGDRGAGSWIDPVTGALRVNVLDEDAAARVRALGAEPQLVAHSMARLQRAQKELERFDAPVGVAWGVDVPSNALAVSVPQDAADAKTDAFLAAAQSLGVPVVVDRVAGGAQTQAFYGGEAILASGGGRCSAGFITQSGSGTQYVVTAGHCTNISSSWSGDGQVIGPTAASSFPGNDYGAIRINSPSALDPRGAVLNNGSAQDINGASRVPVGSRVCKTGSTTGTTCGTVLRYNVTVRYAEGTVYQLTETNVCTQPGDSGGPLFAGSRAQGVVSGGSIGGCGSGFRSYFQPVDEILNRYGLTLR